MALQGFVEAEYLAAKLAALQAAETEWVGKTTDQLKAFLANVGLTPEQHYNSYGWAEGLAPNDLFNAAEYKLAKATDMFNKGLTEGNTAYASIEAAQAAFEAAWPMDAYQHYLAYGSAEGINPSNSFDESSYLASKLADLKTNDAANWPADKTVADLQAALKAAGLTALGHYQAYGKTEGIAVTAVPADEKVDVDGGTTGKPGETFTLTTGVDTLTGTANNDTFIADNTGTTNQLSAADQIEGGAGTDLLKVYNKAAAAIDAQSFGTLSNVEKIYVNNGTLTTTKAVSVAAMTGVTSFEVDSAATLADTEAFTFTMGADQSLGLTKINTAAAGTATINVGAAATVTSANVVLNAVGASATDTGTVKLDATGTGIAALTLTTETAASKVTLANTGTALATLNIAGDQALTLGAGIDFTGVAGTINAANMTGNLTIGTTANDAITFSGGSGKNVITTGSGNDTLTGGAANDTLNAGTGNDTVAGGAGDDTITVGAGTLSVDAGAGADTVLVAGLDSADALKGGTETDTLGLAFVDADAADADTTAGAALRATYSGFEQLRITDAISDDINIAKLGFNYLQIGDDVTVAAKTVSGFTKGATVEYRTAADMTQSLAIGVTDAALTSDDFVNIKLNADLANGDAHAAKFGVNGINIVNVNAVDRVDAAATTDNGPDDGYSIALSNAANVTTLNIDGTAAVSYTLSAGTDAVKTIDASKSTGNVTIDIDAFVGTERVTIKGSQGVNTITGSDKAFGEAIYGGAKADTIDAGVGADDITGNGGRDAFILGSDTDSSATSMDQISDFGKATVAVSAAGVGAMTNAAAFQAVATAKGGDNADLLQFSAVATLGGAATGIDVSGAEATGGAGMTITGAESAKGILTLSGADAAKIDTLAEWVAVANTMAAADNDAVAFEFNNNTYVFQQDAVNGDSVVELTGVTGVTGISLINAATAAAAGDIFVL